MSFFVAHVFAWTHIEQEMSEIQNGERRRAMLRIALGTLQVFAATLALVLLLQTGINTASLAATVLALGLTLTSKALFRKEENGVAHDGR